MVLGAATRRPVSRRCCASPDCAAVAAFGGGADRVLVDGDAETGCRRAVDVAVAEREGCRVGQVVEQAAAVAVADAQCLFLDDEVGDGEVEHKAVTTAPGRTELNLIWPQYSTASWRTRASIPPLAAAYAGKPLKPMAACTDEVITTAPLAVLNRGTAARTP